MSVFRFVLCSILLTPALLQGQTAGGSCSAASLSGTYSLVFSARSISAAGAFGSSLQANGLATFDGKSAVTLTGTVNTNSALGKTFSYGGSYSVSSNCQGTVTLSSGSSAVFTLIVWSGGSQFNLAGSDASSIYAASGSSALPAACANATLSGAYAYQATGFTLTGTTQTGASNESGVFQFDGAGNVTASYTIVSPGAAPVIGTGAGTYSVTSQCLASGTFTDALGKSNAFNLVITGLYGANPDILVSNSQFVRTGTLHSLFANPSQSIGNVASYAVSSTPPGSVFVIFGQNLATRAAGAVTNTLPTTLLTTSVTVNGELAPLFYAENGQIDAQMPWDIPGGTVASVVVKNGSSTSNAAAVYVPATGTPGISTYGNNRAVVVNQNGTINSASDMAAVGDTVVAYFTGGGPVQAAGTLVSGAPAPGGLSPLKGASVVTVGGVNATVKYIGLTPGSIGLYQLNFVVPQIAKGTYPLSITIAGQESNKPVITISN
jgi:uncharacterized protein (TIGR03437 family)